MKTKFRLFDWMDCSHQDSDTLEPLQKEFKERVEEAERDGAECDLCLYQVLAEYNNVDAKMYPDREVVKFNCDFFV